MDCSLKVKLYLENNEDKFMGIGVMWLLQAIESQGSLRAAASSLGISYSKAYSMLSNLENSLNKQIVERKKGGQQRSGVSITPFAKEFISLYDGFQRESKTLLDGPFMSFKKNLDKLLEEY